MTTEQSNRRAKRLNRAGYAMTGTGAVITLLFPTIFNYIIASQLVVKEGNIFTPLWKEPPIGVPVKLYIFSLENPKEFLKGQKAELKQMGPYVYEEIDGYSADKETVDYYEHFNWLYNEKLSVGSPRDKLTIINPATFIGYTAIQDLLDMIPFSTLISPVVQNGLNAFFAIYNESLIKEVSAGDLLNGYRFPIMELVDKTIIKPLEWLGVPLPPERLPENRMGLLNIVNNTNRRGPYTMYTGQGGGVPMTYKYYKGKTSLEAWNDAECDAIKGTKLVHFGNFLEKTSKVWFFFGDFCRSLYFTFKEERLVAGVPTYYFHMPAKEFAGPKRNPDNECFCKLENKDNCDGLYHLGGCYFNVPVSFSYPHFLYASKKIQRGVKGLSPDEDKHEFGLYLDRHAGVVIKTAVRLQVNFHMRPITFARNLGKIPETIMPWVWIEIDFGLDKLGLLLQTLAIIGLYPLTAIDYGAGPALTAGGIGALLMARRINRQIKKNELIPISNASSSQPSKDPSKPATFQLDRIMGEGRGAQLKSSMEHYAEKTFENGLAMLSGSIQRAINFKNKLQSNRQPEKVFVKTNSFDQMNANKKNEPLSDNEKKELTISGKIVNEVDWKQNELGRQTSGDGKRVKHVSYADGIYGGLMDNCQMQKNIPNDKNQNQIESSITGNQLSIEQPKTNANIVLANNEMVPLEANMLHNYFNSIKDMIQAQMVPKMVDNHPPEMVTRAISYSPPIPATRSMYSIDYSIDEDSSFDNARQNQSDYANQRQFEEAMRERMLEDRRNRRVGSSESFTVVPSSTTTYYDPFIKKEIRGENGDQQAAMVTQETQLGSDMTSPNVSQPASAKSVYSKSTSPLGSPPPDPDLMPPIEEGSRTYNY